jgi:hypothetical protein
MKKFIKIFIVVICCQFTGIFPMDLAKSKLRTLGINYAAKEHHIAMCNGLMKVRHSNEDQKYYRFLIQKLTSETLALETKITNLEMKIKNNNVQTFAEKKGLAQTLFEWANIDYTKFKPGDTGIFYDLLGNECLYLVTKKKNVLIQVPCIKQTVGDCSLKAFINASLLLGRWESVFESNLKKFLSAIINKNYYENLEKATCGTETIKFIHRYGLNPELVRRFLNSNNLSVKISGTNNYFTIMPALVFTDDFKSVFFRNPTFLTKDLTFINTIRKSCEGTNHVFELPVIKRDFGSHAVAVRREVLDQKNMYILMDSTNSENRTGLLRYVYGPAIDALTSLIFLRTKDDLISKLTKSSTLAKKYIFPKPGRTGAYSDNWNLK